MTVVFDARDIPETDRAAVIHETVARGFSPVKIAFAADHRPVRAKFTLTDWNGMSVCSSMSSAVMLHRTSALARDDSHPSLFLVMQMTGSSTLEQRGRQVTVRPGDLVVYDSTAPWVMSDAEGIRQHKFRIPLDRMTLSTEVVERVSATTLCPGDPLADLTSHYFLRLATHQTSLDAGGGNAISRPSIELLRALIDTHVGATAHARDPLDATLVTRIMAYVRAHLHDLSLDAERVAHVHHISVRLLYESLAADDVSLTGWLRARRLEECRRALALHGSDEPIATIARRWGFSNASSFARMFRAEFGVSPRQWREMNTPNDSERPSSSRSEPSPKDAFRMPRR